MLTASRPAPAAPAAVGTATVARATVAHVIVAHVIVVGAGTAGSVVAATLSRNPKLRVTLIEAGDDRHEELPFNLFEAARVPSALWPDSVVVSSGGTGSDGTYQRGRGIGGSSEVNGCVASLPSAMEIDSWASLTGDPYWSSTQWASSAEELVNRSTTIDAALWGRADHALISAISHEKGASWKPAQFAIDPVEQRRSNFGFAQLAQARTRPNLLIHTGNPVDRLLVDTRNGSTTVSGVRLVDGHEITADHTIVCAGALGSPILLQRSDVGSPNTGRNLVNHRGVSFTWKFAGSPATTPSSTEGAATPVSCVTAEVPTLAGASTGPGEPSAVQLLPLNQVGTEAGSSPYGGLLCCPLGAVTSRGDVSVDGSDNVTINFPMTDADRILLINAARIGARVALRAVETGHAEAAFADAHGTPASAVASMTDDQLASWVVANPAPLYHAVGTCRMGAADDVNAVIDPMCAVRKTVGLSVIDASSLPTLPAAGPHLAVAAFALHASRRLHALWSEPLQFDRSSS